LSGVIMTEALAVSPSSQLAQLAGMTTLSIDTGDLDVIESFAATGLITDATTNPLFVSQAGLSGDPRYQAFVDRAIAYARENAEGSDAVLELAMDRLAVELGLEIVKLVPGYVSTEADIRASFDTADSLRRARRIIAMYEAAGVDRSRVLIKLAGTWEGICAARELEKEGITCNITLIFGFIQAVAAAQAGARLISPFPGRIKDWVAANGGQPTYEPSEDPGVVCVARMYEYYKLHGHEGTICMPASWRPSRGTSDPSYAIDEIVALAGVDRMTIPPPLLKLLADTEAPLTRMLEPITAKAKCSDTESIGGGKLTESEFRMALNADVCATTKMAEGINAFVAETLKLEEALRAKL
jgi:transaldolase